MATGLKEPDLRLLLTALLRRCRARWPGLVGEDHIKRVEESTNVLLVGARVAMGIAKRAGLPQEDADQVVREAKWIGTPAEVSFEGGSAVVDGSQTVYDVMWACDKLLHHPATRGKFPEWFITVYYPSLCKRVASGGKVTDRDKEVVEYWTSIARGEW